MMQCETCSTRLRIEALPSLLNDLKSRVRHVLAQLEQLSIPEIPRDDEPPAHEECRATVNEQSREPEDDSGVLKGKKRGLQSWECPHSDCSTKSRTQYTKLFNLRRHYRRHVALDKDEKCIFCDVATRNVEEYVMHYSGACKARKAAEIIGDRERMNKAANRYRTLIEQASAEMDRQLSVRDLKRNRKRRRRIGPDADAPIERSPSLPSPTAESAMPENSGVQEAAAIPRDPFPANVELHPPIADSNESDAERPPSAIDDPSNHTTELLYDDSIQAPLTDPFALDDYEDLPWRAPFAESFTMDEPMYRRAAFNTYTLEESAVTQFGSGSILSSADQYQVPGRSNIQGHIPAQRDAVLGWTDHGGT